MKGGWPWMTLIGLGLAVLATQMGNLRQEVILADEATFILMAADVLAGHLPYVGLFDNKPPMIFFALAAVMAVFGESLLAVRLFGDVCLLVSAMMTVAIARRWTRPPAALAGGVFVVLAHAVGPGKYTSTEVLAATFLMLALWALLVWHHKLAGLALAGLLISLATLTRSNLGVVAVGFGLYLAVSGLFFARSSGLRPWSVVPYAVAGLTPPVVLAAIYAGADALPELYLATIKVPLNYAATQMSMAQAVVSHLDQATRPLGVGATLLLIAVLAVPCALVAFGPRHPKPRPCWGPHEKLIVWIMGLSVLVSILNSGTAYVYYWVQMVPLFGLLAAWGLGGLSPYLWLGRLGYAGLALAGLAVLVLTGPESWRVMTQPGYASQTHEVRRAARVIEAAGQPEDRVWAFDNHLILWYLHRRPIARVLTHPDNISRQSILEPLEAAGYVEPAALEQLYQSLPAFVVTDTKSQPHYIRDGARHRQFLKQHYREIFREGRVVVYQRQEN